MLMGQAGFRCDPAARIGGSARVPPRSLLHLNIQSHVEIG